MQNVKNMLQSGDLNGVVDTLYEGLYHAISAVPGMKITKKEFEAVSSKVTEKMENPGNVIEEIGGLGDGIRIIPSRASLTINFIGPDGDSSFKAPEPFVKSYAIGDDFTFIAPHIDGYVASPSDVQGTMDANGVQLEISYSKLSNPPLYGKVSIIGAKREPTTTKGRVVNADGPEVWVYYEGEMDWNESTSDVDQKKETTWMAGYRIDAPEPLKTESDFANVYFETANDTTGTSSRYQFWDAQNTEQQTNHYNNCWLLLDKTKVQAAFEENRVLSWTASYDWNGDGGYEQVIHLIVDPKKITLAQHNSDGWPTIAKIDEVSKVDEEPTTKIGDVPQPTEETPVEPEAQAEQQEVQPKKSTKKKKKTEEKVEANNEQ